MEAFGWLFNKVIHIQHVNYPTCLYHAAIGATLSRTLCEYMILYASGCHFLPCSCLIFVAQNKFLFDEKKWRMYYKKEITFLRN